MILKTNDPNITKSLEELFNMSDSTPITTQEIIDKGKTWDVLAETESSCNDLMLNKLIVEEILNKNNEE